MKENLKIETPNKRDNAEATKLFRELGYPNLFADEMFVYATSSIANTIRTISFDELRELAKPREYLNDKYELVVTNQPSEGWLLVPDGAEFLVIPNVNVRPYFYKYGDIRLQFFNSNGRWDNSGFTKSDALHKILWQRNPKETTMNTEKKGRFLHQEPAQWFIDGLEVQFDLEIDAKGWDDVKLLHRMDLFNDPDYQFRLKPKTMQIGSRTINKPISVKPEIGQEFYVSSIASISMALSDNWKNSDSQNEVFNRNLCHLTKEDAVAHTEALIELMK